MSWKSQQNFTLGFFLNEVTQQVLNIPSGQNTVVYTSPPLPVGVWLVVINEISLDGDLTQSVLTAFVGINPVSSCGSLTDVNTFPSLSFCVRSSGASVVSLEVDCDTSVGTWNINAGKVQLIKLTNV